MTREDNSTWAYQYDALGQISSGKRYWSDSVPIAGQQYEYAYDDSYTWDAENRLIAMDSLVAGPAAQHVTFEYDWRGRRIRKLVQDNANPRVTIADLRYLYDGWNLLAELNASSAVVRSYLWGLDLSGSMQGAGGVGGLLAVYDSASSSTYFAAHDANGNVSALVKAADGSTCARYEYGPFGELIRASGSMAKNNPFRFSTKYQDEETDLVYYGYRYYSPSMEKWLSRDPVGETDGLNIYGFTGNSPINYYDAYGEDYILSAGVRSASSFNQPTTSSGIPQAVGDFGRFVSGAGDRDRNYGPNDQITKDPMRSPGIDRYRENAKRAAKSVCWDDASASRNSPIESDPNPFGYSLIGAGYAKAAEDLFNAALLTPYANTGAMGSYNGTYTIKNIDCCKRVARVSFHVDNNMGLASGSRNPDTGKSLFNNNPFGDSGPLSTVHQYFDWNEDVNF